MATGDLKATLATRRVRSAAGSLAALTAAAVCVALGIEPTTTAAHLRDRGMHTTATVIKVGNAGYCVTNGGCYDHTYLTVAFTDTQGRLVRASYISGTGLNEVHEGESVPIIFDPVEPGAARDARGDMRNLDTFWSGLCALVLLIASAAVAYRLRVPAVQPQAPPGVPT